MDFYLRSSREPACGNGTRRGVGHRPRYFSIQPCRLLAGSRQRASLPCGPRHWPSGDAASTRPREEGFSPRRGHRPTAGKHRRSVGQCQRALQRRHRCRRQEIKMGGRHPLSTSLSMTSTTVGRSFCFRSPMTTPSSCGQRTPELVT